MGGLDQNELRIIFIIPGSAPTTSARSPSRIAGLPNIMSGHAGFPILSYISVIIYAPPWETNPANTAISFFGSALYWVSSWKKLQQSHRPIRRSRLGNPGFDTTALDYMRDHVEGFMPRSSSASSAAACPMDLHGHRWCRQALCPASRRANFCPPRMRSTPASSRSSRRFTVRAYQSRNLCTLRGQASSARCSIHGVQDGRVFRGVDLPELGAAERAEIYDNMADVLAAFQSTMPPSVWRFRACQRLLRRQIRRWSQQYEASKTEDLPVMDKLMASCRKICRRQSDRLAHGDYRLRT